MPIVWFTGSQLKLWFEVEALDNASEITIHDPDEKIKKKIEGFIEVLFKW